MSAITHLFAGVPVSDLDASTDWYTRFFGRPPDSRVGDEIAPATRPRVIPSRRKMA
jgi:catechol 2,3-dioxygenase-like lactoylglutathione lyase family enzyme